jgi:CBS domain-containing protein
MTTVRAPAFPGLSGDGAERRRCVADAMITSPVTHGLAAALADIRAFFSDDHVHMALVVAADGRLVTTIERRDIPARATACLPAATLGTLADRTAGPAESLDAATTALLRGQRRRLAVVDDTGRLLGLLCLKQDGTGYCSDEGVRRRAQPGWPGQSDGAFGGIARRDWPQRDDLGSG